MNSEIFADWFHKKFVPAVKENLKNCNLPQKAVLLIDNAPSHPSVESLREGDIRAVFFPPNTTALIQPMDQGILEFIKRRYRHGILTSLLANSEHDSTEAMLKAWKSINMRDIIHRTTEAWNAVEKTQIIKCWKKLWPSCAMCLSEETAIELSPSNTSFVNLLHRLPGGEDVDEQNIENWFAEENLEIYEEMSDDDIIRSVQKENVLGEIDQNVATNENIDEDEDNRTPISHSAGAEAAETLLKYLRQQSDASGTDIMLVKRLRDRACKKRNTFLVSTATQLQK